MKVQILMISQQGATELLQMVLAAPHFLSGAFRTPLWSSWVASEPELIQDRLIWGLVGRGPPGRPR